MLLAAAFVWGCSDDGARATAPSPADEPKPVKLVTAVAGSLPRTVAATGTLAAEDQVVLNTKVAGRLAELPVDLGSSSIAATSLPCSTSPTSTSASSRRRPPSRRRARALGVPLDGSDDQVALEKTAVVRQARALLTQATAQRSRTASLNSDGILSKAELDQAEADFRVAEARYQEQLEEARSRRALVAERRRRSGSPSRRSATRRSVRRSTAPCASGISRSARTSTSARPSRPSSRWIRCGSASPCPSASPAACASGRRCASAPTAAPCRPKGRSCA
jgi:multidrug efflux pump subunit AcrA (membrane-fusion protein)